MGSYNGVSDGNAIKMTDLVFAVVSVALNLLRVTCFDGSSRDTIRKRSQRSKIKV